MTRRVASWSELKKQQKEQHAASIAEKLEALRSGEPVVLTKPEADSLHRFYPEGCASIDEGSFWIDVPLDGRAEARRQIRAIEEHLDGLGRAEKLGRIPATTYQLVRAEAMAAIIRDVPEPARYSRTGA